MPRTLRPLLLSMLSFGCLALTLSCGAGDESSGEDLVEASDQVVNVPAKGNADTLDIGEWNIEWFGSTGNGPTNEGLQLSNVRDVIRGADLDLWGLEEVVSTTQFNQLKAALPGYDGFLANDARVASGASFYSSSEQKVGVLFKSSAVTVQSAKLILTSEDFNFAGRPPLELSLTANVNGAQIDFVFIVLHAKALVDTASFDRRAKASVALKSYLDSAHPSDRVIVLGDFNDDVDTSITSGKPSPYKNFVDDATRYFFATKALSDAGQRTTVGNKEVIDHHLLTNELQALFAPSSAEVYRVDQFVPSYGTTTSDHFPTLTRYSLGSSQAARVVLNEILANEPGSSVEGEFIELVNTGGQAVDLSGFTLSDSASVRHTFASGTSLAPGSAVVVFGGAAGIPAGLSSAVAASTGALGLNNTTDTVTLKDSAGAVIDSFSYPSTLAATDGVSMNRSPDRSPTGTFVAHTTLSSASSSPGKRVDGTSFGP